VVVERIFNSEFKKASHESVGDFRAQINRNISTVNIDGKEFKWDPSDMMFHLESSIKCVIAKKKNSNILKKEECHFWETSIRKIYMNRRYWDFCGNYYCKDCWYQEREYPKSKIGMKGFWCRICLKRLIIRETQLQFEDKINMVDKNLHGTEKALTYLSHKDRELDDRIEEVQVNTKKRTKMNMNAWENLEREWLAMESGADVIQKERHELSEVSKELDDELKRLDKELLKIKMTVKDYEKDISIETHKVNQK
jgi:hypothetical protein